MLAIAEKQSESKIILRRGKISCLQTATFHSEIV